MRTPNLEGVNALTIESVFLDWLDGWHAEHDYELDYKQLCLMLGVKVKPSNRSSYDPSYERVHVARALHYTRERHESLHEVAHHLIDKGAGGAFAAALDRMGLSERDRRALDENMAKRAGVRLATPEAFLLDCSSKQAMLTERTVALAKKCGVSFSLALRRVVQSQSTPLRGMIIDAKGKVVDSLGHGSAFMEKYVPATGQLVPAGHELGNLQPADRAIMLTCRIPQKNGLSRDIVETEALRSSARKQTLALFFRNAGQMTGVERLL